MLGLPAKAGAAGVCGRFWPGALERCLLVRDWCLLAVGAVICEPVSGIASFPVPAGKSGKLAMLSARRGETPTFSPCRSKDWG